ncbi:hypothetical protein BT08F35_41980 [Escherichia coli]
MAQLVSLITNIETISSTQLTQQTQSILNQINNIRYEKNKSAECRIIVIANPKPDKAIITKISVEEGIPITFSVQTMFSDTNFIAEQRADLPTNIKDIQSLGNDSNLLIVFYVQIMPDDFVMQLHRF